MKFKYVNPKAVKQICGAFSPISSYLFSKVIEEALENINQGYVHTEATKGRFKSDEPEISEALIGISDKLLANNVDRSKKSAWDMYSGLDFDITHKIGAVVKKSSEHTQTSDNPYFFYPEFSRPKKERRIVFHLHFNTYESTEWVISFPLQAVMKGFPSIGSNYIGYSHSIMLRDNNGNTNESPHY